MKTCRKCGASKPISEFYPRKGGSTYNDCKECSKARARADYASGDRLAADREKDYGISPKDQAFLFDRQKESCGMCGVQLIYNRAHLDHDKKTGQVRGFLCAGCNTRLGTFEDPVFQERATEYLAHTPAQKFLDLPPPQATLGA